MAALGRRTDLALAGAFALAALATRGILRGRGLYSWDSGLLAAGILDFDFASGHPHPPYYPLSIAAGKVLAPALGPAGALVALAVVASAVMAGLTYLVARRLVERPWAALAAALVVLSPTALFNGITALTYALEGAASAAVAWAALRLRGAPTTTSAVLLALVASVAVGIRPSSLFLLAPLVAWAAWPLRRLWPAVLGAGAAATLAWVVPMLVAGGGLDWFLLGNRYQSRQVVFRHTVFQDGWPAVVDNAAHLASYVPYELPFLAAVSVALLVTVVAARHHMPARPALGFLAAWILPSLAFFTLLYAGWPVFPSGYVLVLVPGVAVAAAVALRAVTLAIARSDAPRIARGVGIALVVALLVMPAAWAAQWPEAVRPQRDVEAWHDSWWALERDYPANETALVTFYAWFWCGVDHREYLTWGVLPYWNQTGYTLVQVIEGQYERDDRPAYTGALAAAEEPPHPIPPWVKRIVLIPGPPGHEADNLFKDSAPAQEVILESGLRVLVLDPAGYGSIEAAIRWFDDDGGSLI